MLSDPQKRQEYDQFGRESVEGSTVFADAKRHFALMFGGAAFQPFIGSWKIVWLVGRLQLRNKDQRTCNNDFSLLAGEMTMAFVSQLSQPEDEVEKVRQEMELLRFQQLKKKKLAQLLVERARGLIQKSGGVFFQPSLFCQDLISRLFRSALYTVLMVMVSRPVCLS